MKFRKSILFFLAVLYAGCDKGITYKKPHYDFKVTITPKEQRIDCTLQIDLRIDDRFHVIGNGATKKVGDHWRLSSTLPCNDITIAAPKTLKQKEMIDGCCSVECCTATEMADSTFEDIMSTSKNILRNYGEWFGLSGKPRVTVLIAPRETGGDYARKGFIVLSELNERDYHESRSEYLKYFAHELAHLWWSRARTDTWEDWLNESFAEYSALMSVRAMIGDEAFGGEIERKGEGMRDFPAIRGLDRNDDRAYQMKYAVSTVKHWL